MDERDSDEIRKKLLRAEQADRLAEVIAELDAISAREGWRCVAEEAFAFNEDAAPFISTKHGIKISVRLGDQPAQPGASRPGRTAGSDSALALLRPSAVAELLLSVLARLRPSGIIATSDSQTKPWSRTLIEVNTKGKKVRRKSLSRR